MLSDPNREEVRWLDLASGRGQIIAHLQENLSETERKKIRLQGYDIDNAHSRTAARIAQSMGLRSQAFEIGELDQFWNRAATNGPFDFITLTNAIHEVEPSALASILARCIERLSEVGTLFVYDMETLPSEELGAVLWSSVEIKSILTKIVRELGSDVYEPSVGSWKHKTCNGWNAHIVRAHMQLTDNLESRVDAAISATSDHILELLIAKLETTKSALEGLTIFGPETDEESSNKEGLLFQFWSLSRAIELAQ